MVPYLKDKLNQVSIIAFTPAIRNADILVFGKLFPIYKLIHIDLKPRILTTSFLLARLSSNYCQ